MYGPVNVKFALYLSNCGTVGYRKGMLVIRGDRLSHTSRRKSCASISQWNGRRGGNTYATDITEIF